MGGVKGLGQQGFLEEEGPTGSRRRRNWSGHDGEGKAGGLATWSWGQRAKREAGRTTGQRVRVPRGQPAVLLAEGRPAELVGREKACGYGVGSAALAAHLLAMGPGDWGAANRRGCLSPAGQDGEMLASGGWWGVWGEAQGSPASQVWAGVRAGTQRGQAGVGRGVPRPGSR